MTQKSFFLSNKDLLFQISESFDFSRRIYFYKKTFYFMPIDEAEGECQGMVADFKIFGVWQNPD